MTRRVAISGWGVVAPTGVGTPSLVKALRESISGVRRIPEMERQGSRCQVAGVVPQVDAESLVARGSLGPEIDFIQAAAAEAIRAAGLTEADLDSERAGASVACTTAAPDAGFRLARALDSGGRPKSHLVRGPLRVMPVSPAVSLALQYHLKGRVVAVNAACTGGLVAVGTAVEWVAHGILDRCLAGGTDIFSPAVGGICFDSWRAMASDSNDQPENACRPFDKSRSGFVLGEGSGICVVEPLDVARKRGAAFPVEVTGFSAANDGWHMQKPSGDGLKRALRHALGQAEALGQPPLQYVNAHAAGTPLGDPCEARVIGDVLGEARPRVSSIKPLIGHSMGAVGAIELIATIAMMQEGFVAPTKNLSDVDPECAQLRLVAGSSEDVDLVSAASLNLGLGGTNAAMILRRVAT